MRPNAGRGQTRAPAPPSRFACRYGAVSVFATSLLSSTVVP